MKRIVELNSDLSNLNFSWFTEELEGYGYDTETVNESAVTIKDLLINIIKYSRAGSVTLNYTCHPHKIKLHFADEGKRYNPLEDYKTELEPDIKNRKKTGFGMNTTKSISEEFFYKRLGIYNISAIAVKANTVNKELITERGAELPGGIVKIMISK